MKILTILITVISIIAVSYLIKKIYFPEKKQDRVFEGEFEEIDSKEIVIDEFLGQSIPILFFYIIFYEGSVSNHFFLIIVFLSFIGFRFFDILKPYPINHIDKNMKNGFGVILDDLLAGFFTLIVLYICIIFYGQI